MMDEKDIIASNIAYYRKKLGLSQLELAQKIQYSNKNISKWEKGETTPSVFTLKRLAEIFGVTVDELVSVHADGAESSEKVSLPDHEEDQEKLKKKGRLNLSIKVSYLLMTEALLLVLACVAIIVLGINQVQTFNKWLILLYVQPLMCLAIFVFVVCMKKRVEIFSLSIFGWLTALCFYVSFIDMPYAWFIFVLMAAIQLLIVCIMFIINLNIIRRIKNKLNKK